MKILSAFLLMLLPLIAQPAPFTATITFTAPTHYTNGDVIPVTVALTYNLYQGKDGGEKVLVGTITGTSTTINSGLTAGTYCWEVTAVAESIESARSNEGCKTFVAEPPVPNAVVITVT